MFRLRINVFFFYFILNCLKIYCVLILYDDLRRFCWRKLGNGFEFIFSFQTTIILSFIDVFWIFCRDLFWFYLSLFYDFICVCTIHLFLIKIKCYFFLPNWVSIHSNQPLLMHSLWYLCQYFNTTIYSWSSNSINKT